MRRAGPLPLGGGDGMHLILMFHPLGDAHRTENVIGHFALFWRNRLVGKQA